MRLTDPTRGLKQSNLEQVALTGERLDDYEQFWDSAAQTDAVGAIADTQDHVAFHASGKGDAEAIAALDPAISNASVVEIGCGIGRVLRHLAPLVGHVHGVDISAEMVRKARQELHHLPNVSLHHGNGYDLGMFDDSTIDIVFSSFVFQHVPKTVAFNYMLESARILKPQGFLRLVVPNLMRDEHFASFRHFAQPYFAAHPYPMNFYTPQEVFKMLHEAGFTVTAFDDYIVVVARPGPAERFSMSHSWLADDERERYRKRIAELERDIGRMRVVYDHPVVRAGRSVRRRLRPRRPR